MNKFNKDQLEIQIYKNKESMGKSSADQVANKIKELLAKKEEINMVFAAAPSQNEFLENLKDHTEIDWNHINAFHLDEYIGLDYNSTKKFGNYLDEHIFNHLDFNKIYYIDKEKIKINELIKRYSRILKDNPIDIACIGIGENGHIAFNDPPVANFTDPKNFKKVKLDHKCRMQQVHDDCFTDINEVPEYALTMTVPAIYSSDYIYCIVPTNNKAEAVYKALNNRIDESCPASILRSHQRSVLYLDQEAAELLD